MEFFKKFFVDVIKNQYADFSGRATRSQYWYFILFTLLIGIVFQMLAGILGDFGTVIMIIYWLIVLAIFIPSIAITARRLHDTNRSGWWQLIAFVPFIGAIVLIIFLVLPPVEQNKYNK